MNRLTLCVIAKNEERFLDGCLQSVRGLVHQIVVVDTGSTDRTAEIAAAHGATVVAHEWDDNFSAARNAALPHARGEFVLVLDADERLGPGSKRALRKALNRDDFDCGMLPLHDAASLDARSEDVLSGRARRGDPVLLPRLLRRTKDLRWEGVIHEQIGAWASRGKRIARIEAPIVHYGAVPELRDERAKNERNLRLLERRASAEPNNATVHAYLSRELERTGAGARALEVARDSWAALQAETRLGPTRSDVILPATMLGFLAIRAGELDEAVAALTQAKEWATSHPNVDLLLGLAHERRALRATTIEQYAADLNAACASYERLAGHRGRTFWSEVLPGATGAAGAARLGTARLLIGAPESALPAFDEALQFDSSSLEAKLGRLEALIDLGRATEALRDLPDLMAPDCADAWLLAAAAALSFDSCDDARIFAARARAALDTKNWLADYRRSRLDEIEARLAAPQRDESSSRPRVSVVIPVYNRLDLLHEVLRGFGAQRECGEFELIVVDDGSQPPAREVFTAFEAQPNWKLIVHERNRGRGAALNTGLEEARGEIVVFCDSDIVPSPSFVADHIAFHESSGEPRATHLGALDYGVDAGLYGAWMGPRSNPRLRGGERTVDWTQWFTDNWSFRRELVETPRLRFDERHRAWGWEELDFAYDLCAQSATNTLTETARGTHLKAATVEGALASFARSAPNLMLLASKRPQDDEAIGVWLSTRYASPQASQRAESAVRRLWQRAEDMDAAASEQVRDVSNSVVDECAIALSNATFRVGITAGLVAQEGLRDPASEAEADNKLIKTVEIAARSLTALERTLGARVPSDTTWAREVAALLAPAASKTAAV